MSYEFLAAVSEDTWTVNDRLCGFIPATLSSVPVFGAKFGQRHPWLGNNTAIVPAAGAGQVKVRQEIWVTLKAPGLGGVVYQDNFRNLSSVYCRDDGAGQVLNGFTFNQSKVVVTVTATLGTWSAEFIPGIGASQGRISIGTSSEITGVESANGAVLDHTFKLSGGGPNGHPCDISFETYREVLGQPVAYGPISVTNPGTRLVGGQALPWGAVSITMADGGGIIRIVGPGDGGGGLASVRLSYMEAWAYHLRARLVDLDGGDVSRRVIVQKAWPGTNVVGVVPNEGDYYEAMTTPIDEMVSFPRTRLFRAYQCGGINAQFQDPPQVTLDSVQWALDPRFVGVRIPRSTIQGTVPTYSSLMDEWHHGCDVDSYLSVGNGFTYKPIPFDFVFVPDPVVGATDNPITHLSIPSSRAVPGGAWSASGNGASAVGQVLTAGTATGTFAAVCTSNGTKPYRYLRLDLDSTQATQAVLKLIDAQGGYKTYPFSVAAGRHQAWIDLCDPETVKLPSGTVKTRSQMHLVDGGRLKPGYEDSETAIGRFDGFDNPATVQLIFSGSRITVHELAGAVKNRARLRQGASYMPLSVSDNGFAPQHNFYGDVDGLTRFRILQKPQVVDPFLWGAIGVDSEDISQGSALNNSATMLWLDGSLGRYGDIDLVSGGTIFGSFNSPMMGTLPGLQLFGGFSSPVPIFGQMVWGFRATGTCVPPKAQVAVKTETVDGETELPAISTDSLGYAAGQLHYYIPDVRPFRWHGEAPSSLVSLGPAQNFWRHLWHRVTRHREPQEKWRFPNTLNWGCVLWFGFTAPASASLGVSIADGRPGYWIAGVDQSDGHLWIRRAWKGQFRLDYLGKVDEDPECEEPRLSWDPFRKAIVCLYSKGGNLHRRYSLDFGESWVGDPSLGEPFMAGITHAREKYNPRTKERVFVARHPDGVLRASIYGLTDRLIQTVVVTSNQVDDSSFDLDWIKSLSAFDLVAPIDGAPHRWRTLDDARSWLAVPL